mmetsp:Transcript_48506/g.113548  ORF Transcript_48506/g.113548 Transcript_48506/m.113548 type:complete len:349 (+) Transcript_48506:66-1112(+)
MWSALTTTARRSTTRVAAKPWRIQGLAAPSCRAFASGSPKKVALLQDMQIEQDKALGAIKEKGFEVTHHPEEFPDAWALVTVVKPVTEEVLAQYPECKLVAVSFTGFNHVDLEACKKRGISVVNVPAYSTDSVAELSLGLTLAVMREIPMSERTIRCGGWAHSAGGNEIRNKTIGILGLGDNGLRTAELFRAFHPAEILGWSRREKPAFTNAPIEGKLVGLEELFERSDVVAVNMALNAQTQKFVSRDLMEKLKPEAVLVNVARGGVIDQDAMCDLLNQRRFRAGLDVFETEPVPLNDPILRVPPDQVVLTPHVAYKSKEALLRRMAITAENIAKFANGTPQNLVFSP